MVVKLYISGISGNKEVKKKQQRVQMILDSKSITYDAIDITEPGREKEKEFMQKNGKVRESLGKHPLPPQIFNEEDYCGDYEDFDLANETDELEAFLHIPIPSKHSSSDNSTDAKLNGTREDGDASLNDSVAKTTEENGIEVELTSLSPEQSAINAESVEAKDGETAEVDETVQEATKEVQDTLAESQDDAKAEDISVGEGLEEVDENSEKIIESQEALNEDKEGANRETAFTDSVAEEIDIEKEKGSPLNSADNAKPIIERTNQKINENNTEIGLKYDLNESQIVSEENRAENNKNNTETNAILHIGISKNNGQATIEAKESEKEVGEDKLNLGTDIGKKIAGALSKSESEKINQSLTSDNTADLEEKNCLKKQTIDNTVPDFIAGDVTQSLSTANKLLEQDNTALKISCTRTDKENSNVQEPLETADISEDSAVKRSVNQELTQSQISQINIAKETTSTASLEAFKQTDGNVEAVKKRNFIENIDNREGTEKLTQEEKLEVSSESRISSNNLVKVSSVPAEKQNISDSLDTCTAGEEREKAKIGQPLSLDNLDKKTLGGSSGVAYNLSSEGEGYGVIVEPGNIENISDAAHEEVRSSKDSDLTCQIRQLTAEEDKQANKLKEAVDDSLKFVEPTADTISISCDRKSTTSILADTELTKETVAASNISHTDQSTKLEGTCKQTESSIYSKRSEEQAIEVVEKNLFEDNIRKEKLEEVDHKLLGEESGQFNKDTPSVKELNKRVLARENTSENVLSNAASNITHPVTEKHTLFETDCSKKEISELSTSERNFEQGEVETGAKTLKISQAASKSTVEREEELKSNLTSSTSETVVELKGELESESKALKTSSTALKSTTETESTSKITSGLPLGSTDKRQCTPVNIEASNQNLEKGNFFSDQSRLQKLEEASFVSNQSLSKGSAAIDRSFSTFDTQKLEETGILPAALTDPDNLKVGASFRTEGNSTNIESKPLAEVELGATMDADNNLVPKISVDGKQIERQLESVVNKEEDTSLVQHEGISTRDLLNDPKYRRFDIDKIDYTPQLEQKMAAGGTADERGVYVRSWNRRASEADLVKHVRVLLDTRDARVASRRGRDARSPDPHAEFMNKINFLLNDVELDEEEVSWPSVTPQKEPTPPAKELSPPSIQSPQSTSSHPQSAFVEEVLRVLNSPSPARDKPKDKVEPGSKFLNEVKALLNSGETTEGRSVYFIKERSEYHEDDEFVIKVRDLLKDRELKIGKSAGKDHSAFLRDVFMLLKDEATDETMTKELQIIEPNLVKNEKSSLSSDDVASQKLRHHDEDEIHGEELPSTKEEIGNIEKHNRDTNANELGYLSIIDSLGNGTTLPLLINASIKDYKLVVKPSKTKQANIVVAKETTLAEVIATDNINNEIFVAKIIITPKIH